MAVNWAPTRHDSSPTNKRRFRLSFSTSRLSLSLSLFLVRFEEKKNTHEKKNDEETETQISRPLDDNAPTPTTTTTTTTTTSNAFIDQMRSIGDSDVFNWLIDGWPVSLSLSLSLYDRVTTGPLRASNQRHPSTASVDDGSAAPAANPLPSYHNQNEK